MSKEIEILQKLGIDTESLNAEESNIETIVEDFRTKQNELFLQRNDLVEPIVSEKVKVANIISAKKTKKTINEILGLGLTEKELNDLEIQTLLDNGKALLSNSAGGDVKEHQAKIIELQNKITEISDLKNQEIEMLKMENATKEKNSKISSIVNSALINNEKYLISTDNVVKLFYSSLRDAGYQFDLDDNDGLVIKNKDGYRAMTKDSSRFADLNYLKQELIGDLIIKSNGSGGKFGNTIIPEKELFPENIPNNMIEALKKMQQQQTAIA